MSSLSLRRSRPPLDCQLCPRLVDFRREVRTKKPDWHNAPVASFGDPSAQLLIVGLAPGMAGANRTGRPFTGDYAGLVLYPALAKHGFSRGVFQAEANDGVELVNCRITNAVRCLPPQNKPIGAEINNCRQFLIDEFKVSPAPSCVLLLGRIAFETSLRTLGHRPSRFQFKHGGVYAFDDGPTLIASYHCSRYNINTGRLTEEMFEQIMMQVTDLIKVA